LTGTDHLRETFFNRLEWGSPAEARGIVKSIDITLRVPKHLNHRLHRLLFAATWLLASASTALAQELVAPAEVVLYIQSDLKSTDFVRPLVCALQRVLTAPVSTQILDLRLGPELRATPTQFDVGKVADLFIRATAADGNSQSFKYLLIPYDLKGEPWRYVFSTSFGNETTPYHVGVLSTARLDVDDPRREHHQGSEITAMRAYKLILKSIARLAGLKSPDACILAFPRSLDELDRKSSEFCPDDRATLVKAGILNAKTGQEGTDCIAISQREPADLRIAATRGAD
jgi:predicted Zn-dependent protease